MSLDIWFYDDEDPDCCSSDSFNITHNLNKMASEAGVYKALWRPEEIGAVLAADLIPILERGLARLVADPDHYRQFNAPNGWGKYKHFLPFVADVLKACKKHPLHKIGVSR